MKPLFVLLLAAVAVAMLVFAISRMDKGGSAGAVEPGPPRVTEPASRPTESASAADPSARERDPAAVQAAPAPDRTGIASDGFENRLVSLVQDKDGAPVADAKVILTRAGGAAMMFVNTEQDRSGDRTTRTRKDGTFAFENVQPYAHYTLEVHHPEYSRAEVNEVNVGLKGVFQEPTIVLTSGATLSGFVRDTSGGHVPGAEVSIDTMFFPTQGDPSPDRRTVLTDSLGYYEIRNVSPGNRALRVEAEGYGNAVVSGLSFRMTDKIERDIVLEAAEMICGVVVGPGNAPVSGAEVVALSFSNANQQCQELVVAGDDGRFCLERLSPGRYTVAVRAPGYRAERHNRVDTGNMNLVVHMQPQAVVRGKVVDASTGQPVTSFDVAVRQTFEGQEHTSKTDLRSSVTSPAGEFELADLQPGTYLVEAEAQGFAPTFSEPFRVTQGQNVSGVLIRMTKGGSITGIAVDDAGKPVPRAIVETFNDDWTGNEFDLALGDMLPGNATRRQARTNEEGRFSLELLKPESYQVRIKAHGFAEHIQTKVLVRAGQATDVGSVELARGGEVSGMVLDQSGRPIEGATIHMRVDGRGNPNEPPRWYRAKTNAEGRYTVTNVHPGSYRISASPAPGSGKGDFLSEISVGRSSEQSVSVANGQVYTIELRLGG